jgi:hypothetical protein
MAKPLIRLLFCLLVILCLGCHEAGLAVQARTSDAVALSANAALPILVESFRRDGLDAIARVKDVGGSVDDARDAVTDVEERWMPVWKAWEGLRVAQDAWATAVELGGDTTACLIALRDAYCGLRRVWPPSVPAMPLSVVRCPEGK